MTRISIVITNYNFGRFLGDAIRSALEVRWPDKQVIVVDDGSTDESREVIASFGDRITPILKENGGQPSAANAAFPSVTGDVVFFLDSDDMLLPEAAESVMRVWEGGTSKVQFPLLTIDGGGKSTGKVSPNYLREYPPDVIRDELLRSARYLSPPTSGNAFSAAYLRRLFPVPEDLVGFGLDSYICLTAPLYGDVRTITEPLAKYRVHGANSWAQTEWEPRKLLFYIDHAIKRDAFVRERAEKMGLRIALGSLDLSYHNMMHRLACKRALPDLYPFHESSVWLVREGIRAVRGDPFLNRKSKVVFGLWFAVVGLSPRPLAIWAIKARELPLGRPRLLEWLLHLSGTLNFRVTPR